VSLSLLKNILQYILALGRNMAATRVYRVLMQCLLVQCLGPAARSAHSGVGRALQEQGQKNRA
jgi:hypothetical protein